MLQMFLCNQVVRGFGDGRREVGAAGGQRGAGHCLPEARAPGDAERSAAGDHAPEEALSR